MIGIIIYLILGIIFYVVLVKIGQGKELNPFFTVVAFPLFILIYLIAALHKWQEDNSK